MAQELLPQIDVNIQNGHAECERLQRLCGEEQSKFNKERDKLTHEIGGIDSQLKKTAEKRRYYEDINIESILQRVEQETVVEHELERQKAMRREFEKNYANVMDRYKALADKIDLDLQGFITDKQACINSYTQDFISRRESLMQELRKAEVELRAVYAQKIETVDNAIGQLTNEENGVKIKKAKVDHENPFANEMAANEQQRVDLRSRQTKTQAQVRETELQIESLRQESLKEQEIADLKYQASLTPVRKEKADIEAKIEKLASLLEKSKGSFSEWLDSNKPGWQDNIGKVADEAAILYNDMLNPQVIPEQQPSLSDTHHPGCTLYGVSIDLAAVVRKFRTPEELKKEKQKQESLRSDCINRLNTMQAQHEEDMKSLTAKKRQQIRKLSDTLHELNGQLSIMPQEEKRIMRQALEISKRLDDWRKQQLEELESQMNAIVAQKVRTEEEKKRIDAELERKLKNQQTDYNRQMKTEKAQVDTLIQEANTQIEDKHRQTEQRKEELRKAQYQELQGKGMDTTALDVYNKRIDTMTAELAFIREHRDTVAWYRKDKEELFDQENAAKQERKQKEEKLSQIESKYRQCYEKLMLKLTEAQKMLRNLQVDKKKKEDGLEAVSAFRSDDTLCPIESGVEEEKPTMKDCLAIVDELKREIYDELRSLNNFKRDAQDFLGMFSAHNTFHFNVSPVTEEEFFAFAANLAEFIDNDKISEYQKRISGRYTDIILRISKEVGDLTRSEGDISKTINDINRDFQERNFAGVIREISLRPTKTNDRLMLLLLRIKEFADDNLFDMGEMDLFATASRQDVNAKAVKFLLSFMNGLLDEPHRKLLQVADTFKLEFRIRENDNDTGWVEKIANVGSDGTDILVKAMVNIMLINVFKEKASKKSGDFKIHCMMDEIGKLHPNNVKGILDFANRRNILLVNSSPTTYNVEDYKYTYLLSKDSRANTKVVQLIKNL